MRKCKKCEITKELIEFPSYKPGYRRHICNECYNEPRRQGGFPRGNFKKGHVSLFKGKKLPKEQVEKSAKSRRKNTGTRWTWEYRNWKKLVLEKSDVCTECGSKDRLECHHIKSWKEYPELKFDVNNGQVLCKSCHRKLEGFQKGHIIPHEIRKKMSESHLGKRPPNKGHRKAIPLLKECNKCQITKKITEFFFRRERPQGRCKDCQREIWKLKNAINKH